VNANDITCLDDPARVYAKRPATTTTEKLPLASDAKAGPRVVGQALLKALGMEHQNVLSVDIHCAVNDVPTVTVKRFISKQEAERLEQLELKPQ
jgi:hypothetical protein